MKEETARKLLVENSDDYIKGCLATTLERMRMNEVRSPSHYFAAIVKSGLVKQTQLDFGQEDTISDKLLCRFSEEEQSFLRAIWDHLNSGDRLNIERYGLSSGHIKMMFEDWTRKQKRLKAK